MNDYNKELLKHWDNSFGEYSPVDCKKASNRISWDEYALKIAETVALRSEDIYVKVGACVLDKDNRIVGVGYNGLAHGKSVEDDFWNDRDKRRKYMIHAETNALTHVERNQGVLLACTLLPCGSCATQIATHGIKRVIYRDTYKQDTSSIDIFEFYGIKCEQI